MMLNFEGAITNLNIHRDRMLWRRKSEKEGSGMAGGRFAGCHHFGVTPFYDTN